MEKPIPLKWSKCRNFVFLWEQRGNAGTGEVPQVPYTTNIHLHTFLLTSCTPFTDDLKTFYTVFWTFSSLLYIFFKHYTNFWHFHLCTFCAKSAKMKNKIVKSSYNVCKFRKICVDQKLVQKVFKLSVNGVQLVSKKYANEYL